MVSGSSGRKKETREVDGIEPSWECVVMEASLDCWAGLVKWWRGLVSVYLTPFNACQIPRRRAPGSIRARGYRSPMPKSRVPLG